MNRVRVSSSQQKRWFRAFAFACSVLAVAGLTAACSSSAPSGTSGGSASGSGSGADGSPGITASTIKIGLLTSFSGPIAALFSTVGYGFNARLALQNAEGGVDGRKLVVVDGDDQGSAAQALSAAQTLVGADNVFAVGGLGTFQFSPAKYLQQQNIPVIGYSIDGGPEWASPYTNTVAVLGSPNLKHPAPVAWGEFLKSHGATKVAVISSAAPGGIAIAKNIVASAEAAGLKQVYLNVTIPLTQTAGFDAVVQAIKASGADAIGMAQGTASDLGFIAALQQAGVKPKVLLVNPAISSVAINNAQVKGMLEGSWSAWPVQPTIDSTASNKIIKDALAKYEHQTGQPDQNELSAWASADAIIQGLKLAGPNPTRATFLDKLHGLTNYAGGGTSLSPVNIASAFGTGAQDAGASPGDCIAFTQYTNGAYQSPVNECGGLVPNSDAG